MNQLPKATEQYLQRLAGYVEGKDPLAIQRETAGALARLIGGVPAQQLARRPAADKWSIVEILAHLAEDELVTSWRYRQMLEHDRGRLSGFDQDLWARVGAYATWDAGDALALFRLLRNANLRMLDALSPEQWERSGEHAERGRLNLADLARHMAAHDINHLQQIEKLLPVRRPAAAEMRGERSAARGSDQAAPAMSLTVQEIANQLRRTPVVLRELITALPSQAVAYHPGPEKW